MANLFGLLIASWVSPTSTIYRYFRFDAALTLSGTLHHSFAVRVVNPENSLPVDVEISPSIDVFKASLDGH